MGTGKRREGDCDEEYGQGVTCCCNTFHNCGTGRVAAGFRYDWNLLPIGQLLRLKELQSYVKYPPLQDPASYNLDQVLQEVKKEHAKNALD